MSWGSRPGRNCTPGPSPVSRRTPGSRSSGCMMLGTPRYRSWSTKLCRSRSSRPGPVTPRPRSPFGPTCTPTQPASPRQAPCSEPRPSCETLVRKAGPRRGSRFPVRQKSGLWPGLLRSRRGDSNPQPSDYKSDALPVAPHRRQCVAHRSQRSDARRRSTFAQKVSQGTFGVRAHTCR